MLLARACASSIAVMAAVESILKEALELSPELRAQLVGELMRTLPAAPAALPRARATTPPAGDDTPITWEGAQGFLED